MILAADEALISGSKVAPSTPLYLTKVGPLPTTCEGPTGLHQHSNRQIWIPRTTKKEKKNTFHRSLPACLPARSQGSVLKSVTSRYVIYICMGAVDQDGRMQGKVLEQITGYNMS